MIGNAQNWNWAKAYGKNQSTAILEIKKGHHNDVFMCGRFVDSLIIANDTLISTPGYLQGFIARLDTSSNFIWIKTFNVNKIEFQDIEVNSNNELILLAGISNSVTIDTFQINYMKGENVVAIIDENGQVLKTHNFGSRHIPGSPGGWNQILARLALDSQDNPIISFSYRDSTFLQIDTIIGSAISKYALVKLDTALQEKWVRTLPITFVSDVTVDHSNNIILAGETQGSTPLDTVPISANCGMAGIIAKLNNQSSTIAPTFVWQKNIKSIGPCAFGSIVISSYFNRLVTDVNDNIYAAGAYMNTCSFGSYTLTSSINNNINFHAIVSKLNANGNIDWYKTSISPYNSAIDNLRLDSCNNILVSGFFQDSLIFGTGQTLYEYTGQHYRSIFVSYLDNLGNVIWKQKAEANLASTYVCVEKITNTKVWIGGTSHYQPLIFGTHTPTSNLNGSAFFAEISQSSIPLCNLTVNVNKDFNTQDTFLQFPNPFSNQTTILFTMEQNETLIKIVDMFGKEIKTINFSGKQLVIQKDELSSGIYFLIVANKFRTSTTRKMIVQ